MNNMDDLLNLNSGTLEWRDELAILASLHEVYLNEEMDENKELIGDILKKYANESGLNAAKCLIALDLLKAKANNQEYYLEDPKDRLKREKYVLKDSQLNISPSQAILKLRNMLVEKQIFHFVNVKNDGYLIIVIIDGEIRYSALENCECDGACNDLLELYDVENDILTKNLTAKEALEMILGEDPSMASVSEIMCDE